MKCKLQVNQIKMKEAFGGLEFGLTELCFPSPGLGQSINYMYRLFLFRGSILQHYIGLFFEENIFLYVGCSRGNLFDNLKHRTLVCKNELQ